MRDASDGGVGESLTVGLGAVNLASETEVQTASANHAERTARETNVSCCGKSRQNSESGHDGVERVVKKLYRWIRENGMTGKDGLYARREEALTVIQSTSALKTQCHE